MLLKFRKNYWKRIEFYANDVCDMPAVEKIFKGNNIDVVIHFAAYMVVGESIKLPIIYY